MEMLTVVVIVVAVGVAAALAGVEVTRRRLAAASGEPRPADESVRDAVALALVELRAQAAAERDAAVHAAIEQAAVLGREQLGAVAQQARQQSVAELGAKQDVIDSRLDQVRVEMRTELEKLSAMVAGLAEQSAAAVRAGRSVAAQPRRGHPRAVAVGAGAARGDGLADRPWAVGRAHGRRRAAARRLRRERQLRQADPARRRRAVGPTSRSRCRRATSSTWTSSSRWPGTCASSTPRPTPSARRTGRRSCATCAPVSASWHAATTPASRLASRSTTC